jgi:transmembrane sensor
MKAVAQLFIRHTEVKLLMNITQLKRILNRYLAGNASEKETALMEEWCDSALTAAKQTPVTTHSDAQRLTVLENLRNAIHEQEDAPTGRIIHFRMARRIAAACIILLGGTALGYRYQFALLDILDPIPVQKVTALKYQVKQVVLPDSSVVVLNAGSEITFPKRFRGNKRNVQLNGEAFFAITRNPLAAFTITAPHLQVQVLGTSFVMADSSNIAAAKVSVKTGRVAVTADAQGFPATQLTAHQELVYDQANGVVNINKHQEVDIEWTNKQLVFNGSTLADVFREIEKVFRVKIKIANPVIGETKFTGAFDTGDSLSGMLNVIALSYRLTIHEGKDGTIMIR